MTSITELFGYDTSKSDIDWGKVVDKQFCKYSNKKCFKTRKSSPDISIGTCTLCYGKEKKDIIICPHRLLERNQIFTDCLHLLEHTPGNELHIVPEVRIPGGNVDYFLVSATPKRKVKNFVGIELQTMDTTGSIWPSREKLLDSFGIQVSNENDLIANTKAGMNWKMTAKTILVQLHHKVNTFEYLNKHLVLVIQSPLLEYMKKEFSFSHVNIGDSVTKNDSLHFHSYELGRNFEGILSLQLEQRLSTDAVGMAKCLGLEAEAKVELKHIVETLERKISDATLLSIGT